MRTSKDCYRMLAVLLIAGIVSLPAGKAAIAATFTYPGPVPCNTTLQACIDAAASGDTVEIATNAPIDESPYIENKSLTLRAAPGFTPILTEYNTIYAIGLGTAPHTYTIQGITLQRGVIGVGQGSTGTLTANVWDNTVLETFSYGEAVRIWAGNVSPPPTRGDIFFSVLNNQMTIPVPFSGQITGISIQPGLNLNTTGVIRGNRIVMQGNSQGAAIDLPNGTQTLTVDVIDNVISGATYDAGISLFQFAPGGTLNARVINNLITGQYGNVGAPAGIAVSNSQGTLNFSLINNTVSDNRTGILISGRMDLGAVMNGVVANNIIANSALVGVTIDGDLEPTVTNSYNLLFNNPDNWFTPGPNTLYADPRFIWGGNYRLGSGSPAVNAGDNAAVPFDITTDLDGNPRVMSGTVDLGAYEVLSPGGGGGITRTYSISGRVTTGAVGPGGGTASPLAGVNMTLGGDASAMTSTDAGGNYAFPGLPNGNYTVTPTSGGYAFSPTSLNVTISGADRPGQNFVGTP